MSNLEDHDNGKYPKDFSYLYSINSGATNIVINRNAKYIRGSSQISYASKDCTDTLVSFTFQPDPLLEVIQDYAFFNCIALTSVDLSMCTRLETISRYAFSQCSKLSKIILPNLKALKEYVFEQTAIEAITLPSSLTIIPDYCFRSCKSLKEIVIFDDSNVTYIGRWCIISTKITSFNIPAKVTTVSGDAFEYSSISSVSVNESNKVYYVNDGMLINNITKSLTLYPPYRQGTKITVPEGIVSIGPHACRNALFNYISLPSTLKKIEGIAFGSSRLIEIEIPDSVEYIGGAAFYICNNLNKIKLPSTLKTLTEACFKQAAITRIDIPQTVTSIEGECFLDCKNLMEIILPDGLQSLGGNVFSSWTKITFGPNSTIYLDSQFLIIDKINKTIFQYIGTNSNANINILPTIEEIKTNAFKGKNSISVIDFGQNTALKNISDGAFEECTNIVFKNIPSSV